MADWDRRFLRLARQVAAWSKDPSTKTGAVVVAPVTRSVVSHGYNGFPRGVPDDERLYDRELKLKITMHAELNALLCARRDLTGHSLYSWPLAPCSRCAAAIIQAGVSRVVAPPLHPGLQRWAADLALAEVMFKQASVALDTIGLSEEGEA